MRIRANQIVGIIIIVLMLFVFGVLFRNFETTPSQDNIAGQIPGMENDPDRQPKIELETTELDLGVIDNTELTRAQVKVYNRGNGPLRITRVQTSCAACTLGGIDSDRAVIPPGGESYIDIVVIPQGIPGFYSEKYLTVISNDPERPMLRINVTKRVEPEFEITPEHLDLGQIQRGSEMVQTVHFRQLQEERIVINQLDGVSDQEHTDAGGLRLSLEEIPESEWQIPGKAEYNIRVIVEPDTPPGPFERRFIIHSNVKRLPQFPYYLSGFITSHYQVTPAPGQRMMLFQDDDEATMETGTVRVSADLPIDITSLQYDDGLLTVLMLPRENPRIAEMQAGAAPGLPPGNHDTYITFNVVSEDGMIQERVAVRIYVPTP